MAIESPLIQELVEERLRSLTTESPLIQELAKERLRDTAARALHDALLAFLEARFGSVPQAVADELRSVTDEQQLTQLARTAAVCPNVEDFRAQIRP